MPRSQMIFVGTTAKLSNIYLPLNVGRTFCSVCRIVSRKIEVHTGDYSRRFRRQFLRQSPNSATVAVFCDCPGRRFWRQCGQGFTVGREFSNKPITYRRQQFNIN